MDRRDQWVWGGVGVCRSGTAVILTLAGAFAYLQFPSSWEDEYVPDG